MDDIHIVIHIVIIYIYIFYRSTIIEFQHYIPYYFCP